ncbi:MAG: hypothetical protein JSR17_12615 [Proteobacteria bacterium]|nr:hypothetical protein [Pseudomonadota bacterium]
MDSISYQKVLKLLLNSQTYPGLVQRKDNEVKLTLWRNNTLGNFISWTIFEVDNQYYLRQIRWEQRNSYLLNEPNTYGADIMVSQEIMHPIMKSVANFDFNLLAPKNGLTIDGVKYGINIKEKKVEWYDEPKGPFLTNHMICLDTIRCFENLFC